MSYNPYYDGGQGQDYPDNYSEDSYNSHAPSHNQGQNYPPSQGPPSQGPSNHLPNPFGKVSAPFLPQGRQILPSADAAAHYANAGYHAHEDYLHMTGQLRADQSLPGLKQFGQILSTNYTQQGPPPPQAPNPLNRPRQDYASRPNRLHYRPSTPSTVLAHTMLLVPTIPTIVPRPL
jgi:hypothetical protein